MRITLLGTGGGAGVQVNRCQTGLLIEVADEPLLIDCGAGVTRRLAEASIQLHDISRIFFTHYHSDHLVDYPEFVLSSWVMGRRGPLKVFGPIGINRINNLLFGSEGVFDPDIRSRVGDQGVRALFEEAYGFPFERPSFECTEIAERGSVLNEDKFSVTAEFVEHVPEVLTCLAYRFSSPEGSVVFSGDTRALDAVSQFAYGADVLIHDCTRTDANLEKVGFDKHHTGPIALGKIAQAANVKCVVMTHFSAALEGEAILTEMAQDVRRSFTGDVVIGSDLLTLTL